MDLRQLRYFVALTTAGHYHRAAAALHVTQPALSRQVQLLEQELGVKLFERHARGATPTEEAHVLLERARRLLREVDDIKSELAAMQREPKGPVTIGLSPGLAQQLTVRLTQAARRQLPEVRLRFVEGFAPALQSMLARGEADIALLIEPIEHANLVTIPLLKEQICLIGLPGDPRLAPRPLRIQHLEGIPLVMTGLVKPGVRLELDRAAALARIRLDVVVEVETAEVARRLVLEGVGLTAHFAANIPDDLAAGRLRAVPIEGLFLDRLLARPADRPASRATLGVMRTLREVIEAHVASGGWPNARLVAPAADPGDAPS